MRQAVDQIEVDAREREQASGGEQGRRIRSRLRASDRLLHACVEVLHAHRHAIEAELPQRLQLRDAGDAGIDLDRELATQAEVLRDRGKDALELHFVEERRRPTAPVHRTELAPADPQKRHRSRQNGMCR